MIKEKLVPVYSIAKMMELVKLGYIVRMVVDNKENPKFKVFMFVHEYGIENCIEPTTPKQK